MQKEMKICGDGEFNCVTIVFTLIQIWYSGQTGPIFWDILALLSYMQARVVMVDAVNTYYTVFLLSVPSENVANPTEIFTTLNK